MLMMVHPTLAWRIVSGWRFLRAIISPGSVRMKSRTPTAWSASVLARKRGISEEAGRVLNATRRILPTDRAYRAASTIAASSISYCARRRLHPLAPT
jgi:hypothetical protein